MRKRMILALGLVLALLLSAVPAMAAGSVNAWLSADSTSVSAGSSVTVTVSAEVDSCGSGGVEVSFDSSVFELTGGSCTVSGAFMTDFSTSSRDGVFAFDSASAISGTAFQFTLKVKSGASAGSHTVSVTFFADGTPVTRSINITVACEHTYDNGCDETCNRCGGTREVSHSWDGGKVTREATCSKSGEKLYTCSACGGTKTEETDPLPHDYEVIDYFPATCTENGGMSFECRNCGYTYDDYIEANGHSYENNCDEECDTCGETREVEHVYADPEEEGVEVTWLSDRTGHWQECAECKKPQEPIPHTPGPEATETEDQVCLDCGFVIKAAVSHTHTPSGNFLGNDTQHWFLCACGQLMGQKDHHWTDKGIQDGQHVYKCVICSRVKTEPVETTAPTEVTTVPTESTAAPTTRPAGETTDPNYKPVDHVGLLVQWWVIPIAIVVLAILGLGIYVIIAMIVAYRKPGKYDAKKKK